MTEEIAIAVSITEEQISVNLTAEGVIPMIHYGSGLPAGTLGATGDSYVDTARSWLYQKTGSNTWTFRGAMALSLSNAHVQFVCPDGVTRRATLSNLP